MTSPTPDDDGRLLAPARCLPSLASAMHACRLLGLPDDVLNEQDHGGDRGAYLAGLLAAVGDLWEVTVFADGGPAAVSFTRGWAAAYNDTTALMDAAAFQAMGAVGRAQLAAKTHDELPAAVTEQLDLAAAAVAAAAAALAVAAELIRPAGELDPFVARRLAANVLAAVNTVHARHRTAADVTWMRVGGQ